MTRLNFNFLPLVILLGFVSFACGCQSHQDAVKSLIEKYQPERRAYGDKPLRRLEISDHHQLLVEILPHLPHLKKLVSLSVHGILLTADDLEKIGALDLGWLNFSGCTFETQNFRSLASMDRLESLSLSSTNISDEGVATLASCETLKHLDVSFTELTGKGFRPEGFNLLEKITLTKTRVNDENVKSIAKLPALKWLGLGETEITSQGINHLSKSHLLEYVSIPDKIKHVDVLAARELHIAEKQKARAAGIDVPPDRKSPWSGFENRKNEPGFLDE